MLRSCLILLLFSSLFSSSYAQLVATPANIVCYQEVVATQGTYAQIDTSLKNWSQKLYNTLNLTGPIELSVGWARVPDRTGFENNCTGPYPNIADLFVHIQTNTAAFDSISSALESFIAANRMTSQPNIVCSARSIITYLPGCGKVTGGAGLNNATSAPTNASGTTSAPTNSSGTSNSTIAPTLLPSNGTSSATPSNITTNSTTTAPPINSTTIESSSTGISSNSTNSTLPTETASSTSISTNTTSSFSSISSNATTGGNSTTTNSTDVIGGAATQDQSASGGVTFNSAYTTTITMGTLGIVMTSTMNMIL